MGKRIVVKVGSNVLTRDDGKLDVTRMSAIVDQIVWLKKHDYEVILVSSGAVAAGRAELHVDHHLDSVEQRQLFSAIGQVKLVGLYYNLFREYKIKIGQVLTMKENFGAEEQYKNLVIAYEPVWAIGTGKTASAEQAQEIHAYIRQVLTAKFGAAAQETAILYGGSCKPSNAAEIFAKEDVDGGLIGGAALKAEDFLAIGKGFSK